MSNWDSIYQNYQQGGEAWATLSEDIDPRLTALLKSHTFPIKHALDTGCGTGKYLAFLENHGWQIAGIDSSPTAVEMTKKALSAQASISVADMYIYDYPAENFDLIISVSTLHHGRKKDVHSAIKKIYHSVVAGGSIFITLPDLETAQINTDNFADQQLIEPGTYAPLAGPETGLAHSFFREEEVTKLFSQFKNVHLELDEIGRWFITGQK